MKYTEIMLTIALEDLEAAEAICSLVVPYGFQVEDYSDLEVLLEQMPRELIDNALFEMDRTSAKIHLYISEKIRSDEAISYLEDSLKRENITYTLSIGQVDEEDYANAWKKHYKPLRVGKNLMIVPSWETYEAKESDIILEVDPGMAFGTGTHETTRLCMEFLEELVKPGDELLDVGCGSGILAVTGVKLGAASALGTDIDPVAITVSKENAERNGLSENIHFMCANLATDVEGKFDVICANIVADAIILLSKDLPAFLKPGGQCIFSGIIDARALEVEQALQNEGYRMVDKKEEAGWVAYRAEFPA